MSLLMFTLTPRHCCRRTVRLCICETKQYNMQFDAWGHIFRGHVYHPRSCFRISFICGSLVGNFCSSVSLFPCYLHPCLLFSSEQTGGMQPHLPPCCCWYLHCCFLILLSCCVGLESSLRVMTHWTVTQTKRSVCFSSLDCWQLTSSQTLW